MKITIVVLAVFAGVAVARPESFQYIPILSQTNVQDESGQYAHSFQAANGISAVEQGALKANKARTGNVIAKQGSFAFVAPDGKTYTTVYTSDERGFIAQGDHLPRDSNTPIV